MMRLFSFVFALGLCASGVLIGCCNKRQLARAAPSQGRVIQSEVERSPTRKNAKDEFGDVRDWYVARFLPVDDVEAVAIAEFTIDTGGLDWFDGNCLQDREDCKDFATIFGAPQAHLVGAFSGQRSTTTSGTPDAGETFRFDPQSPAWEEVKRALVGGAVSFQVHTNIAESDGGSPYTVRLTVQIWQTP